MKSRMSGFTLVEISVALLALGIALIGATVFWQQSASVRVAAGQQDAQVQARQSLVGFLYAQHRLPCPAADADGAESCASGGGLRQVGYVPWKTLGLPRPEAGRLRYGVYREASATAASDRDFASARDRMNPLRVPTPFPKPTNGIAPNAGAPPFPVASVGLLGATQSGNVASPLNPLCNASGLPPSSKPCPDTVAGSVNLVDVCVALNTASGLGVAPAGRLGVRTGATSRAVAFVVAAPGLLDADGDGQGFDGANALASDANPTFESSSLSGSHLYDDQVLAVSHAELFSELHCATGLAAAEHSHFNTATGAFVLERALYDYRDQLYVKVKLAQVDELSAIAGVTGAIAGVAGGAQAIIAATADTVLSVGARSFQIGLAVVGTVAAALGTVAAAAGLVLAEISVADTIQVHEDFKARTTAITNLSISINENALIADAIGF